MTDKQAHLAPLRKLKADTESIIQNRDLFVRFGEHCHAKGVGNPKEWAKLINPRSLAKRLRELDRLIARAESWRQ